MSEPMDPDDLEVMAKYVLKQCGLCRPEWVVRPMDTTAVRWTEEQTSRFEMKLKRALEKRRDDLLGDE